jgi:RHS repeat-associated protein
VCNGTGKDTVSDRLSEVTHEGTDQYNYNEAHRITDINGVSYSWDNNGNLLSDGDRTFTYDHADRLTSVFDGSSTYAFAYDGLGHRYQQTIDSTTTTYALDIAANLTQVLSDGSNDYLYGLGRIGGSNAGEWQYTLADALGNVRQLSDSTASITLSQSYEPFGSALKSYGDVSSDFGFTGEQDEIAGLVFLRARYYDPGLGRFITKDPFPGVPSLPSTLHPYQYALNNPVNLVDPSGEIIPALIGALVIGALIGGIGGGINFALNNQGMSLGDMVSSGCFWRSVGIGAAAGAIAGLVGWAINWATPILMVKIGFSAHMTFGAAIFLGALSGPLASVAGQLTQNDFLKRDLGEGIFCAAIGGAIIGGIAGGLGYKIREWFGSSLLEKQILNR